MAKIAFFTACLTAFLAPFILTKPVEPRSADISFRGFPTEFEGRPLRQLELSERERFFLEDFPGNVGRFTDGDREIVIRRVTQATRKLHPASDCFRAVGYAVAPLPLKIDDAGKRWACFSAVKTERFRVCERIEDGAGGEWLDASSWYWDTWHRGNGEWWAFTVARSE